MPGQGFTGTREGSVATCGGRQPFGKSLEHSTGALAKVNTDTGCVVAGRWQPPKTTASPSLKRFADRDIWEKRPCIAIVWINTQSFSFRLRLSSKILFPGSLMGFFTQVELPSLSSQPQENSLVKKWKEKACPVSALEPQKLMELFVAFILTPRFPAEKAGYSSSYMVGVFNETQVQSRRKMSGMGLLTLSLAGFGLPLRNLLPFSQVKVHFFKIFVHVHSGLPPVSVEKRMKRINSSLIQGWGDILKVQ
ncbi:hypothetical protein AVEN_257580-1 [Araneus ventricosus]|uniref:Uncharacterized protein n=1 Tax=Araneus ventricosus TaxID=182803 RepID=A0A4Y2TE28_ARAVE|nr:hypothetical protein AVEN_257580-1 [Araneus ventricosus]